MRRAISKSQAGRQGEIAAVSALLFGLALLHATEPLLQVGGGLLALAGGIPLAALGYRTLRRWQSDRAADFAAAQRQARKAQRREREALKKEFREKETAAVTTAERKRQFAESERQKAAQAKADAETRARTEREQQIEAEVRRWQTLPEPERRAALTQLLRERGLEPLLNAAADERELRFAGAGRVALYLSANRRAAPADLERLQILRVKHKAPKGYLISVVGFAPEAVRALPDFPALAFADPYLLADWSLQRHSVSEPGE